MCVYVCKFFKAGFSVCWSSLGREVREISLWQLPNTSVCVHVCMCMRACVCVCAPLGPHSEGVFLNPNHLPALVPYGRCELVCTWFRPLMNMEHMWQSYRLHLPVITLRRVHWWRDYWKVRNCEGVHMKDTRLINPRKEKSYLKSKISLKLLRRKWRTWSPKGFCLK